MKHTPLDGVLLTEHNHFWIWDQCYDLKYFRGKRGKNWQFCFKLLLFRRKWMLTFFKPPIFVAENWPKSPKIEAITLAPWPNQYVASTEEKLTSRTSSKKLESWNSGSVDVSLLTDSIRRSTLVIYKYVQVIYRSLQVNYKSIHVKLQVQTK
jgi:hypothetical protein